MRISDWSSDVCSSDLDRPLFEHAEQFDLHVETHVADFVEKERAALARFEMADAAGMGAGEAALFMPEEFGFDEFAGNRAAVDRGKGLARTDAFVVDRAGDQFLARARDRKSTRLNSSQ